MCIPSSIERCQEGRCYKGGECVNLYKVWETSCETEIHPAVNEKYIIFRKIFFIHYFLCCVASANTAFVEKYITKLLLQPTNTKIVCFNYQYWPTQKNNFVLYIISNCSLTEIDYSFATVTAWIQKIKLNLCLILCFYNDLHLHSPLHVDVSHLTGIL